MNLVHSDAGAEAKTMNVLVCQQGWWLKEKRLSNDCRQGGEIYSWFSNSNRPTRCPYAFTPNSELVELSA